MKVHFYLRYATKFGESFSLCLPDGSRLPLKYLSDDFCIASLEIDAAQYPDGLAYSYEFHTTDGLTKPEADPFRRLDFADLKSDTLEVYDFFNLMGLLENVFTTQPFRSREILKLEQKSPKPLQATHVFRAKAPLLKPDEAICLLGHGKALNNWDTTTPILLKTTGAWWETHLDLSEEEFPLSYKYGVWNARTNKFLGFEEGGNRPIYAFQSPISKVQRPTSILHDNFARLPLPNWKGAGVAIPVFSLRSKKSWGVGEFTDLPLLVDWSKSVGLKLIQLLPINDTTANHSWKDSYPYSSISAFALHPIYVNVETIAGKKHAEVLKPFMKKQKALNALETVDYEAVLQLKWDILRQLYDLQKVEWINDADYQAYYESNKHWLAPYAVFCWLRDTNGTADFNQWSKYSKFKQAEIEQLLAPIHPDHPVNPVKKTKSAVNDADQIGLHLFVQWHLHLQLKAAADYAHAHGLSVKGDIPIGIYRYSCDAWVAPDLYNMNAQAGAPPDDFAEKGQNWGFPTYNWAKMKADGFAWWKQRFEQMSLYFDAFRIDHILGFFRIWSIPMDAVEGILGQFVPAIPVTEDEFQKAGIGFNYDRLCRPYITDAVLREIFGSESGLVAEQFLVARSDGRYDFKAEFDTQREIKAWMKSQPPNDFLGLVRDGLYSLMTNVILLLPQPPHEEGRGYAFRFGIEKTSSFQHLPEGVKAALKALYVDYFYRRQDDFWQREAMEKLPALKAATQMLICGEDLGMVPGCVPDVMKELGILSLEIQRMPKAAGATFFHPKDAPYLSVVTPSTHDMSTLRGWWEEDRALTQRFYNEMLQRSGEAPYLCEAWVNKILLEQHFHSPAMWAIFQLQDLLGMDGKIRRKNPHEERINIPANPKHYWRYRAHIALEDLMKADGFNKEVRKMVQESGRG
ncbi:MAG: 4-alpha-glucanotransferase [Saprospiraceae bacterium]|nr:4-alpha-glucanotransferase [Saprospiraceae bacterium]